MDGQWKDGGSRMGQDLKETLAPQFLTSLCLSYIYSALDRQIIGH